MYIVIPDLHIFLLLLFCLFKVIFALVFDRNTSSFATVSLFYYFRLFSFIFILISVFFFINFFSIIRNFLFYIDPIFCIMSFVYYVFIKFP